jgi:hypothetical protein
MFHQDLIQIIAPQSKRIGCLCARRRGTRTTRYHAAAARRRTPPRALAEAHSINIPLPTSAKLPVEAPLHTHLRRQRRARTRAEGGVEGTRARHASRGRARTRAHHTSQTHAHTCVATAVEARRMGNVWRASRHRATRPARHPRHECASSIAGLTAHPECSARRPSACGSPPGDGARAARNRHVPLYAAAPDEVRRMDDEPNEERQRAAR